MAFLLRPRELPDIFLCGNPLPWVDKLKHIGNMVTNKIDGRQLDIIQKRAKYIDKNNTILQELSFAHPTAKIKLNNIYNCHSGTYLALQLNSMRPPTTVEIYSHACIYYMCC